MSQPMLIRTHNGFGDVIFERPVIQALCTKHRDRDLYLACAFPEMFDDLPVRFVPARSKLAWSTRHMAEQPAERWSVPPVGAQDKNLRIGMLANRLRSQSMVDLMAHRAGVKVDAFSLPALPPSPVSADRIAVIRPVTSRVDWNHDARNPLPEYIVQAAALLREAGYYVVSVAAISEAEPYQGEVPVAHQRFDHGELGPLELLALVRAASLVVTGPSWTVPAALACGTPLVCIAGGAGLTNGPTALVPSWYGGSVSWVKPPRFCMCEERRATKRHACPKEIPDFAEQFMGASRVEAMA